MERFHAIGRQRNRFHPIAIRSRDEGLIHKHAELSGFPASKVTEVRRMIDPTTEKA